MINHWESVSSLPYHYGLYLRGYAPKQLRDLIKLNYDTQRFVYNNLTAEDLVCYKQTRYNRQYAPKYRKSQKTKQLKMVKKTQYRLMGTENSFDKPERCRQIRAYARCAKRFAKKMSIIKEVYQFLRQKQIDSLVFAHARMNHSRAWLLFDMGVQVHVPTFHKKNHYNYFYDTSCIYHKNKDGYHVGSVHFLSRTLIKIPKYKKPIRISGMPKYVWKMIKNHDIRIGSIKIEDDNLNHVNISLQIASDKPFKTLNNKSKQLTKLAYDLNTSNFLACTDDSFSFDGSSDGFVRNPRYYERKEYKLKRLKRCLSRKYNHARNHHLNYSYCKNYQKNRIRLAKISKHVRNQRFDFLQRLSTKLVENQDFLVGENLKSSNMLRNHRIAKAIQSVGWREFISMIEYKAKMYHKIYVLVNPAYTTQMCSKCGYVMRGCFKLGLNNRVWQCPNCGAFHVRDKNASVNIMSKGLQKILKYLPKRYYQIKRCTSRQQPIGFRISDEKVLLLSHNWLKYLVTHYYGVIDSSRQNSQELIPKTVTQ